MTARRLVALMFPTPAERTFTVHMANGDRRTVRAIDNPDAVAQAQRLGVVHRVEG